MLPYRVSQTSHLSFAICTLVLVLTVMYNMRSDHVAALNDLCNARDLSLNGLFSLTHSTIFALLSAQCLQHLEDQQASDIDSRHAGPITSKSLLGLGGDGGLRIDFRAFKIANLEYLKLRGLDGIHDMMYSTMKKLKEEKEKFNVVRMFEGFKA
jgi:hypothetical protein